MPRLQGLGEEGPDWILLAISSRATRSRGKPLVTAHLPSPITEHCTTPSVHLHYCHRRCHQGESGGHTFWLASNAEEPTQAGGWQAFTRAPPARYGLHPSIALCVDEQKLTSCRALQARCGPRANEQAAGADPNRLSAACLIARQALTPASLHLRGCAILPSHSLQSTVGPRHNTPLLGCCHPRKKSMCRVAAPLLTGTNENDR